jgi:hypothetical protein
MCTIFFVTRQFYSGWIEGSGHADCFHIDTGAFDCSVRVDSARYHPSIGQAPGTIDPANCSPDTCAAGGLSTSVLVVLCVIAAVVFLGGGGFLIYWFGIRGEPIETNVFREGLTEEDEAIISQQV